LVAERVWNGDKQSVELLYKNLDRVWFRLVEFDFAGWEQWGNQRTPQQCYGKELQQLLQRPAAKEWSSELPKTADYKQRTETIDMTAEAAGLKPGCYVLICSATESFKTNDRDGYRHISLAEVWLSELAAVVRRGTGAPLEIQVFNALSGQPVKGAQIEQAAWIYDGRNSRQGVRKLTTTDENGIAKFSESPRSSVSKFIVRNGDQQLGVIDNIYNNRAQRSRTLQQTLFFSDRSIYRPGQSIQFKGICFSSNQFNNEYKTLLGRNVTVQLYDANNQVVETKQFRTNEFGSFAGSFTAPRNRVTGQMYLKSSISGFQYIRVEEYKRPKFFVEVDKPSEAFQLGQKVDITGTATGYTGAAVDGAKVNCHWTAN